MSRKILFALMIALTGTLLVVGVVAAQETTDFLHPNGPGGRGGRGGFRNIGEVTAINGDEITVTNLDGEENTILVGADTEYYFAEDRSEASLADVQVGAYISAKAQRNDSETAAAVLVILPDDFDPADFPGDGDRAGGRRGGRSLGEITAIGTGQFTVVTLDGEERSILVTADTEYNIAGDQTEASFADLAVGQWVAGHVELDDENLIASRVVILPEDFDPEAGKGQFGRRQGGRVVSVSGDTLTVETRNGETLELVATADTEFFSQDDTFTSLADLAEGDHVGFSYEELEDGTLQLNSIATGGDKQDGGQFGPGGPNNGNNGNG